MRLRRSVLVVVPAVLLAASVPLAFAAVDPAVRQSRVTGVGVHNSYEKAVFPYLADALDSGASLVEIDVWVSTVGPRWRVNHDLPVGTKDWGQRNNCTSGGLRSGGGNQGLDRCFENLRLWHDQNPGHRPITVKIEFKNGFNQTYGAGPAAFDALVRAKLGDTVFTPGDLLGDHPTLDAAAKADNWPTRERMAGRFMIEVVPGTFERGNPFDKLHTDVEYGRWVRDNPRTAQAFPTVLDAQAGDPRTRFAEPSVRPWFVVFDGNATSYAGGGVDPQWYGDNNYYLVMTGAHGVAPALDATNPPAAAARERVEWLAKRHASIVSTDWARLGEVLELELPRG
ncbi:phosphatidylinositol-specific phospholipase C domain-containing protein [Spirilliplanes yamanashiensis]|uniref:Lipoprotein n=1 Tax=Spirilliplanes yamanashiensis TaxID=42233 RepID=A0A8J3Y4Y7_9ACTN|nr:phosphatidylinositol-specific phospholipase C domain-containing protein [Spirilliplanes yamanashiensis]MDP9819717.1 hypothetical protein [Spirilliplanes yamanashiensis]GIJ01463.1 lipoprotein [Spirilliplanes yamanashiensis]